MPRRKPAGFTERIGDKNQALLFLVLGNQRSGQRLRGCSGVTVL